VIAGAAHEAASAAWLRISGAKANFVGHYQPHVPAELGYYAAGDANVKMAQVALARSYGIDAFCYFCEWTGATPSPEIELNAIRNASAAFPYCVCWENAIPNHVSGSAPSPGITRRPISVAESLVFLRTLLPLFADPHYLRVHGRPILIVAVPELLEDLASVVATYRDDCARSGAGDPYLVGVNGVRSTAPSFDATIELPPMGFPPESVLGTVVPVDPAFCGDVRSYRSLAAQLLGRARPSYKLFRTAMPGWDNTPREGLRGVTFAGSSPEAFGYWVERIAHEAILRLVGDERLIFVRSWNEWDVGCHLEPDARYGRQYLVALSDAIEQANRGAPERPTWPTSGDRSHVGVGLAQTRLVRSIAMQPMNGQGPTVSVVMPAYNHESFVARALDSVLAQTYGTLEVIVVDDGSRDATGEVLDDYARRCTTHPLTVVHQQNAGAHEAINRGLALARGQFVALINSDDLYATTRLQHCLNAMAQRDASFAFSATSFVNEAGAIIGDDDRYVAELREFVARGFQAPHPVYALISRNIAISSGNFVFRRELLEATGGFCALPVCHDWDFILAASYHTALAMVDQPLYIYRVHGANTFSDRGLSTRLEIEQLLSRFFRDIYRHPLLGDPADRGRFLSHVRKCGLDVFLPRV
jgi:glycosyltransferase involved in cell wall biosynthesis